MFVRGPRGVCPKKNKIPVSFFLKKSWCWLQLPWTRFRVVSSAAPVKSGRDCINRGADMSRERDSVCRWCSAAPPAIMHKLVSAIFTGEGTCADTVFINWRLGKTPLTVTSIFYILCLFADYLDSVLQDALLISWPLNIAADPSRQMCRFHSFKSQ